MRKREIELQDKKNYIDKFLKENNLRFSFKEYTSIIKGHDYKNIIYTEEMIQYDDFYFQGLVDIKDSNHKASKSHTNIYFKCDDCGTLMKNNHGKKINLDTDKLLCQKCSCKYTNLRKSKREKNSSTIKKRYDNGELDYMKEISKKLLIERNKTTQKEYILNLSDSEKKRIAIQKRKTFNKRPEFEKQNIYKKMTIAFRKYNELKSFIRNKYLSTLSNEDLAKTREYSYATGDNWKKIKESIIIESNNICSCCNKKNINNIDIHHSIPFALRPQNIELVPLCRKCHINIEWDFRHKYLETEDSILSRDYSLRNIKDLKLYREFNGNN